MPKKLPPAPPGFPWKGKFAEVKQIKEYFSHEKLQCLLCGREYGNLGLHLTKGHDISHDDYKARFGIPWTYGLAGARFKAINSKRFKKLIKQGKIKKPSKAHIAKLHKARSKMRPGVEAFRNDSRRKILEQHGREEKWQIADYEEFITRIGQGRTPAEVGNDEDMPSKGAFQRFIRTNPKLQRKYEKIWARQPHSVHTRAAQPTEKFYKDVLRLRRKDKTWSEIANELAVSEHSARSAWHRLKAQGKLKGTDSKHEIKRYSQEDYDEFLRRVSIGRLITEVAQDPDMPQSDLFYIYMRKNPIFKRQFQRMWENLPYKYQARSRRMGKKFSSDIQKLWRSGYTISDIARKLEVKDSLVRRYTANPVSL